MSVEKLEQEFSELLSATIPVIPERVKTLFDIARFPHYEDVTSNFYAYYLDPSAGHGLTDLFIVALCKLVIKKTGRSFIDNYNMVTVEREVNTKNGKFIDILIQEPSDVEETAQNAIIIENKIYAALYNDLNEYYNHVKVKSKKIGIVLSIRKEVKLPSTYVNILHSEFILEVEQSAGTYFINAEARQLVIFKEFIQNIKSLTMTNELSEQYDFYLKHEAKIREIVKLRNNVAADVFNQVNQACEKLNLGLELKAQYHSQLRYYFSTKAPVYFTIWMGDFFSEKEYFAIFVELNKAGIQCLEAVNTIDFTQEEREYLKETTAVRTTYIHYAEKSFEVNEENFKNLTDFIVKQITTTPLQSIFLKIEAKLSSLQDQGGKIIT